MVVVVVVVVVAVRGAWCVATSSSGLQNDHIVVSKCPPRFKVLARGPDVGLSV